MQTQKIITRPISPGQLLLASMGWTASSWGGWLAVVALANWLLPPTEWLENASLLGFPLMQALVWVKAVPRGWRAAQAAVGSVMVLPTGGWLLLLVGFHVYALAIFLVGLAFALGGPMQF